MIWIQLGDESNWDKRHEKGGLLVVNIFKKSTPAALEQLNQILSALRSNSGPIIAVFESLRLQNFGYKLQGVAYSQVPIALFTVNSGNNGRCWSSFPETFTNYPIERIEELKLWFQSNNTINNNSIIDNTINTTINNTTIVSLTNSIVHRSRPLLRAEEVKRCNEFFDFIGEVVYCQKGPDKAILVLTDYTLLKYDLIIVSHM